MILQTVAEDYALLRAGKAPRGLMLPDTPIASSEVLQMLADVAARVRATFSPASWLIVEGGELVGLCSITRPPGDRAIDIGYGVAPSRQGRGFASRAIGDIVAWANTAPGLQAVTAETGIANVPSQRVLARNGFVPAGTRNDEEDGPLVCWRYVIRQESPT